MELLSEEATQSQSHPKCTWSHGHSWTRSCLIKNLYFCSWRHAVRAMNEMIIGYHRQPKSALLSSDTLWGIRPILKGNLWTGCKTATNDLDSDSAKHALWLSQSYHLVQVIINLRVMKWGTANIRSNFHSWNKWLQILWQGPKLSPAGSVNGEWTSLRKQTCSLPDPQLNLVFGCLATLNCKKCWSISV